MFRWFRGLAYQKLSRFNPKPKRRAQKTWRLMVESLEDRFLPSISVGPNINISRFLGNQNEPTLAMNPTNPLNLFASANNDSTAVTGGLFAAFSNDGGSTWTRELVATGIGTGAPPAACCDSQAFFDSFGNLYLSYFSFTGGATLLLSSDGGVTFSRLANFTDAIDQPHMAVGPNTIWDSYADTTGTVSVRGASVTGLGAASIGPFSAPVRLPGSLFGNFGGIAVGPSGQVVVDYQDSSNASLPNTILENINPTGLGGTWSQAIPVTITNVGVGVGSFPITTTPPSFLPGTNNTLGIDSEAKLAWDVSAGPHNGRLYIIYCDAPNTLPTTGSIGPDVSVYTRFSDDNGLTWSARVRVNDFDNGLASHFLPNIVVDSATGTVAAEWWDTRNDLGQGFPNDWNGIVNDDAQLFISASFDGGVSWAPNVKVTPIASHFTGAVAAGGTRNLGPGDYQLSTAFINGVFYPVWCDNSNSTGDNPNGTIAQTNLYTAQVLIAPGAGISPTPIGIVLGGTGSSGSTGGTGGSTGGGTGGGTGGPINIVLGSTRNAGANSFSNSFVGTTSAASRVTDAMTADFMGTGTDQIAAWNSLTGQWTVTQPGSGTSTWATWNPAAHWTNLISGDFNGDGKMDIAAQESGHWWVGLSTGSGFTTSLWASWSPAVAWTDVHVADFNGDGKGDIIARPAGSGAWWMGTSNGSGFDTSLGALWSSAVTWVDTQVADFNGDGLPDIAGRVLQSGQWWTGINNGAGFTTSLWGAWNPNVAWTNVMVGDFNGDGKADIVGRVSSTGQWWVGESSGAGFSNALWGTWNPSMNWVDVQVGDFNGAVNAATGLPVDDITGRVLQTGQWWTGISNGASFRNSLWDTWSTAVNWVDVQVGNFNGDAVVGMVQQTGQWWMATPTISTSLTGGGGSSTAGLGLTLGSGSTPTTTTNPTMPSGPISGVLGGTH
jgi:hypothetical protein